MVIAIGETGVVEITAAARQWLFQPKMGLRVGQGGGPHAFTQHKTLIIGFGGNTFGAGAANGRRGGRGRGRGGAGGGGARRGGWGAGGDGGEGDGRGCARQNGNLGQCRQGRRLRHTGGDGLGVIV